MPFLLSCRSRLPTSLATPQIATSKPCFAQLLGLTATFAHQSDASALQVPILDHHSAPRLMRACSGSRFRTPQISQAAAAAASSWTRALSFMLQRPLVLGLAVRFRLRLYQVSPLNPLFFPQ